MKEKDPTFEETLKDLEPEEPDELDDIIEEELPEDLTLEKALKEVDPDQMLFIGCKDGSSWFFADYKRNLNLQELNDQLWAKQVKAINCARQRYLNYFATLATVGRNWTLIMERRWNALDKHHDGEITDKDVKERIASYAKQANDNTKKWEDAVKNVDRLTKSTNKLVKEIAEWQPLKDRRVLDRYNRIREDGLALRIAGDDCGKWWTHEEFLQDKEAANEIRKR